MGSHYDDDYVNDAVYFPKKPVYTGFLKLSDFGDFNKLYMLYEKTFDLYKDMELFIFDNDYNNTSRMYSITLYEFIGHNDMDDNVISVKHKNKFLSQKEVEDLLYDVKSYLKDMEERNMINERLSNNRLVKPSQN